MSSDVNVVVDKAAKTVVMYPANKTVEVIMRGPQGPGGASENHDHTPEQVGFHVGAEPPEDTSLIWIQTPE